jgi:hypothetical protein
MMYSGLLETDSFGRRHRQRGQHDPVDELIRRSGLRTYRYERNADSRRRILAELQRGVCRRELFSLNHVAQRIAEEAHASKLSSPLLAKYQTVLWQSKSFTPEPDRGAFPLRERMLRLRPDLLDLETLVANYDRSILYKCNVVLTQDIVAAGLRASGIGTVVMVHANGAAYEVEFMTLGGKRWPS